MYDGMIINTTWQTGFHDYGDRIVAKISFIKCRFWQQFLTGCWLHHVHEDHRIWLNFNQDCVICLFPTVVKLHVKSMNCWKPKTVDEKFVLRSRLHDASICGLYVCKSPEVLIPNVLWTVPQRCWTKFHIACFIYYVVSWSVWTAVRLND